MPSTEAGHGDQTVWPKRPSQRQSYFNVSSGGGSGEGGSGSGRKESRTALPIAVEHVLSPLIDTLPSLPDLKSLKAYLPTSPPAGPSRLDTSPSGSTYSKWQSVDLGDGSGRKNMLLVSTQDCALRIYRTTSSKIPQDPQVVEEIPAPEEVFSIATLRRDASTRVTSLPGVKEVKGTKGESVISAQILNPGELANELGPVALLLTSKPAVGRNALPALSLVVLALRTGLVGREIRLGSGRTGSLQVSARAIAILIDKAIADPSPTIHLLHPSTLLPLFIIDNFLPQTPIFSLSGRLLAYVIDQPPRSTGSDGLGTLITARTTHSRVVSEGIRPSAQPMSPSASTPAALASAAVSIGGGVARGVWAGLKMGAQAANQVNAARLARSAPAESMLSADNEDMVVDVEDDGGEAFPAQGIGGRGGQWIKIIDLGKLPAMEVPPSPYEMGARRPQLDPSPKIIAHFRLPHSRSYEYINPINSSVSNSNLGRSISYLSWDKDGTQLFASPSDGRVFHIFQVNPNAPGSASSFEIKGCMLHLYELKRGTTAARVKEVVWDESGRWIGVATDRGTIHVYPIHPSGAPATSITHIDPKTVNPSQRNPLSQIVESSSRIRLIFDTNGGSAENSDVTFSFARWQDHPLENKTFCQDINIFRPSAQVIELQRLSVKQAVAGAITAGLGSLAAKRGSGITQMMRLKSKPDDGDQLNAEHGLKARWLLPDTEGDLIMDLTPRPGLRVALAPLANAEIRTYSINPRILPSSIYLSHQVDFYSTQTHDNPSKTDTSSRQRLIYRTEVQIQPGPREAVSFDEPLSTALHTRIESPTRGEIPGLPNGIPSAKWKSPIPIRSVAAGVGEGFDRVRQTYVKAQAIRRKRRASEHQSNKLSFEEGAVFPSSLGSENRSGLDVGDDSSPASGSVPSDSAIADDNDDDDEWAEGWEDEYRRAVEVEGEPDDLVLGILDEEERERRGDQAGIGRKGGS